MSLRNSLVATRALEEKSLASRTDTETQEAMEYDIQAELLCKAYDVETNCYYALKGALSEDCKA